MIERHAQFWFPFFRKVSRKGFSTTFCVRFSRKVCLMLSSINWPNFVAWKQENWVKNKIILSYTNQSKLVKENTSKCKPKKEADQGSSSKKIKTYVLYHRDGETIYSKHVSRYTIDSNSNSNKSDVDDGKVSIVDQEMRDNNA